VRASRSGSALHAQRRVEIGSDEIVLVRLDRGHDVAHGPHPRALDLLPQEVGREPQRLAAVEVLVLVRGEQSRREAEPAAQSDAHALERRGAVEAPRDRGPPVDDDRIAGLVAHMAAADVQDLRCRGAVVRVAVGPSEERRCRRVGGEGFEAFGPHASE
jgi:hypothetical protein